MIIRIGEAVCIGCGVCAKFCPGVFRMNGFVAKVVVEVVPAEVQDLVQATAEVCPVAAIAVRESHGNSQDN